MIEYIDPFRLVHRKNDKEFGRVAYLTAGESLCKKRSFINGWDAHRTPVCWKCGLYHD